MLAGRPGVQRLQALLHTWTLHVYQLRKAGRGLTGQYSAKEEESSEASAVLNGIAQQRSMNDRHVILFCNTVFIPALKQQSIRKPQRQDRHIYGCVYVY